MNYDVESCSILARRQLTPEVFALTVYAPRLAPLAVPGQFAQVLVPGKTLRRPVSLCRIGPKSLELVIAVRGEGTAYLSQLRVGESLSLLAPLGSGFPIVQGKAHTVLVGGGIGVPPLVAAAEKLEGKRTAVLGFRTHNAVILTDAFRRAGCAVEIATDDGTCGTHGLVTDVLQTLEFDLCYACGPLPMLRAVAALCAKRQIPCYLSMEERMACGIGACLGCAVELKREDGSRYYGHVCKDGPVFAADRVVLEGRRNYG